MAIPPIREWERGEQVSAARLSEPIRALNGQREFTGGHGIRVSHMGGTVIVELDGTNAVGGSTGFWAEITGNVTGLSDATAAHTWVEQELVSPFGFQAKSGGRTNVTEAANGYEANGRTSVVPGDIVWMDVFTVASGDGVASKFAVFDLTAGLTETPFSPTIAPEYNANTESWDVNAPPEGTFGFAADMLYRVYLGNPDSGDANQQPPKWYSRNVTVDSNGNVSAAGAEIEDEGTTLADVMVATGLTLNGTLLQGTKYKIALPSKGAGAPFELDLAALAGTDQYVAVQSGDTPGYLDTVLAVASPWLTKTPAAGVLTISHAGPDSTPDRTITFTGSGGITCSDTITFDSKGHEIPATKTISIAGPGSTTVTVLTNMRYDAATHKFQKKTIEITVIAKGTESAWTDCDGDQPVSMANIVTDVAFTSPTLTKDRTPTVYVLEAGTPVTGTTVFTGDECA